MQVLGGRHEQSRRRAIVGRRGQLRLRQDATIRCSVVGLDEKKQSRACKGKIHELFSACCKINTKHKVNMTYRESAGSALDSAMRGTSSELELSTIWPCR